MSKGVMYPSFCPHAVRLFAFDGVVCAKASVFCSVGFDVQRAIKKRAKPCEAG